MCIRDSLKGVWENGVLTGKGLSYGCSLIRPEATGYGAMYYLQEVLKHENDTIEGKRIAISGTESEKENRHKKQIKQENINKKT